MSMKKMRPLVAVMALLLMGVVLFGNNDRINAQSKEEGIAEGIYIESLYIGGMSEEEANVALEEYVAELAGKEFTLEAGDKQLTFTAGQMGLEVLNDNIIQNALDVGKTGSLLKRYKDLADLEHGDLVLELRLGVNRDAITALINDNLKKINTKAVDNGLIRENGTFTYVPGTTGIEVNVTASTALIEEYICTEWNREDATVLLSAEITEPKGSREELAKVKDLLGSYNTNFRTSSAARITNINVATDRINGTVLYPGEEFSVNETIQPRDAAHGYKEAGSYEGGQTVQSYGGGVCQVSTTLYNAVILAELGVTERQSHSMTVAYVPLSMDAAIAGDYLDFKFVNNTETPIYIEGYTKGKDLYFNIYGEETRPANREISFETVVLETMDPGTQFVASEDPMGSVIRTQSKHIGYKTQLWKIEKVDGVEKNRELFNKSSYRSSPKILKVGIATDNEALRSSVYSAIATGDAATIYDALYWTHPEAAAAVLN